jgi:DNA processing protein
MTEATIVIESADRGGSLITANLANDYNRDVFAWGRVTINTLKAATTSLKHKRPM